MPVVRHADRLSLAGLAAAIEDLSSRARTKQLTADELKGGTFTVSNPGRAREPLRLRDHQPAAGRHPAHGRDREAAGGARRSTAQDAIVIRPMMHLALSYDHRAVDGAPANGFLHRVRELLEEAEFDL